MNEGEVVAAILGILLERTAIDFSQYRPPTIVRRIRNRMLSIRAATLEDYLTLLQTDAHEATSLAQQIVINVSRFYRNASTFDIVRQILPALADARRPAPLRLWSAGCGCGEEAYTLAILLDAAGLAGSVDATDIDEQALASGAAAIYSDDALSELPGDLCDRYLAPVAGASRPAYQVAESVRRRVRFQYHDLTTGRIAPDVSGCDLVSCRNVLIYFQPGAQSRTLEAVIAAVHDDGIVCLGEAEWPPAPFLDRLKPLHPRARIFRAASPQRAELDRRVDS